MVLVFLKVGGGVVLHRTYPYTSFSPADSRAVSFPWQAILQCSTLCCLVDSPPPPIFLHVISLFPFINP